MINVCDRQFGLPHRQTSEKAVRGAVRKHVAQREQKSRTAAEVNRVSV